MTDVRTQLLRLGMTETLATLAVPYVWFAPGDSDQYATPVVMLIRALQAKLNRLGYSVRTDGYMDAATEHALAHVAGGNWKSKTWLHIVEATLRATTKTTGESAMACLGCSYGSLSGAMFELGSIDAGTWTKTAKGSCKPVESFTLEAFTKLQQQCNRVLVALKRPVIEADGVLGAKTVAAVNAVLGLHFTTCDQIAAQADSLATQLAMRANAAGVPATPPKPKPSSNTPVVQPGGQVTYNESMFASLLPVDLDFSDPLVLGALGLGGLLLWKKYGKGGKAKGRSRSRRRR